MFAVMSNGFVDIGVNWVQWLRDLAARHYVWDARAGYHRVIGLHKQPSTMTPARSLRGAWERLPRVQQDFPHLKNNFFVRDLAALPEKTRARISLFFEAHGMRDFEFLGHGGRAIAYRALHAPSGQMRVARMEGVHSHRFARPDHPVVLQPYVTNEGLTPHYGDIKVEILPEIVPLSRLYDDVPGDHVPMLKESFQHAIYSLARGVNMMHGASSYDNDADAANVGLRPDGRIVSLDPEVVTGARAQEKQRHFKTPSLLRDASAQQLLLIYPGYR